MGIKLHKPSKDGKCKKINVSIEFQKRKFQPMKCLRFWIWWGEYIIDIRELKTELNLEEGVIEMSFENRVASIIKALDGKCLLSLSEIIN